MTQLNRIVGEWYHRWVKYGYYGDPEKMTEDTEFQQAKEQVKALILELIGEDEKTHGDIRQFDRIERISRNELRDELRRKVGAL